MQRLKRERGRWGRWALVNEAEGLGCGIFGSRIASKAGDRPAKQVRGIPQVEPILIEQGPDSYKWLGVLGPPVRKA